MKKRWIILAVALSLLLILAVRMPCKTVITTEMISSVQDSGSGYPEELGSAISEHLFEQSTFQAFAESVYIVREEYLFKKDTITYAIPYMRVNIDDVGTAGTADWTVWLDVLALNGEDFSPINTNGKWNRSESAFTVEADPNTYITAECGNSVFDSDPDNCVSAFFEKRSWSSMDEYVFRVRASTWESEQPANVDTAASFRWESSLSCPMGKTVGFVVEATVGYMNNCKG